MQEQDFHDPELLGGWPHPDRPDVYGEEQAEVGVTFWNDEGNSEKQGSGRGASSPARRNGPAWFNHCT